MKKLSFLFFIFFTSFSFLWAQPKDSFDTAVDFSLDLKGISRLVRDPSIDLSSLSRALIFDGSVAAVTIIEADPQDFLAELEIVSGEWAANEAVFLYRAYVYLQGPDFAHRLPQKTDSQGGEGLIGLNNHALVVGDLVDVYEDESGDRFAVIMARHLRIIP